MFPGIEHLALADFGASLPYRMFTLLPWGRALSPITVVFAPMVELVSREREDRSSTAGCRVDQFSNWFAMSKRSILVREVESPLPFESSRRIDTSGCPRR